MAARDRQESVVTRQTVVLLGASNLVLGWNSAIRSLTAGIAAPLDIYVACGLGRSYVAPSRFAVRRLPGILQCGLWADLPESSAVNVNPAPLILLTDIGNDLVYRRKPAQILQAVEDCISRLRQWRADCRIMMTGLPLPSIHSLSRPRFQIARLLLFPGAKVSLSQIEAESEQLNSLIRDLAAGSSIPFFEPPGEWYGFDPIHIRRGVRDHAFGQLFGPWANDADGGPQSCETVFRAPPLRAQEREVFGRILTVQQPCSSNQRLQIFSY